MREVSIPKRQAWMHLPAEAQKQLDPSQRGPSILLVEDDEEMRRVLARALRRDGYGVVEARDGSEALEQLGTVILDRRRRRTGGPALLITDVRLPGFSGLEILEGMRLAALPLPAILITAFGDAETHADAYRLGATYVLDKPFDVDELRAAVQLALAP
jgi:DNA-binding response OmpR family regulator